MADVTLPILTITKPANGDPVSNAKIYIGNPDVDPTVPANQKQVSARQENGSIVPLPQPIRTNAGGNPQNQGSPVALEVTGSYSITILDANDAQIFKLTRVNNAGGSISELYTDSGSANAYVITPASGPTPTQYFDGMRVRFRPANTNTSTSITIQIPGLPAVPTDFNVIGGLTNANFAEFTYNINANPATFEQDTSEGTVRGFDDGFLVAGSNGQTQLGNTLLWHAAAGATGADMQWTMTDANSLAITGVTGQTFRVAGVSLAEMDSVLAHGTAGTGLVVNTIYPGSVLRAFALRIPTGGGAPTSSVIPAALTGSWLCKTTVTGVAGQHNVTSFFKVA